MGFQVGMKVAQWEQDQAQLRQLKRREDGRRTGRLGAGARDRDQEEKIPDRDRRIRDHHTTMKAQGEHNDGEITGALAARYGLSSRQIRRIVRGR